MDVNGLNMFEQPYGQYTVVHPMVNPPACDAPSDDVHWYTKTLGVLTTPQCQMPWKPAGLTNLSNWCWVQIEICWEGITLPVYHAMGSWPLGRACGKHAGSVRLLRRDPVSSKFLSGMWEPAFWQPSIYDQEGTTNDICLLSWHQVAQYVVDFWNMKEHVLPP